MGIKWSDCVSPFFACKISSTDQVVHPFQQKSSSFLVLTKILLLAAKLLEGHYEKAVFQEARWSKIQDVKREVDSVGKCGVLCLKSEECNAFHFANETNLCTLALANTWDLVKIQMDMCLPKNTNSKKIEVFTASEGKNIGHDNAKYNYYISVTWLSSPCVFLKSQSFPISRNNKLEELPFLGRQYVIFFELYMENIVDPNDKCTSIVHFTIGGNHENYGDRTPALFYCKDGLVVASAIDGDSSNDFRKHTLVAGHWYKFFVSQLLVNNQVIPPTPP